MLRALLLFDGRAALEKDLRLVNLFVDEVKAWLRESTNDSTLKLAKAFMVTVSLPPVWTMPIHVEEGRREKTAENGAQVEVPSRARSRAMSIQRSEESSLSLDFTSIILYS
jgi:hypothetical protein